MRINRDFFNKMMGSCIQNSDTSSIITKDLDRTFFYFFKHKDYKIILKEAKNVLTLWEVSLIRKITYSELYKIYKDILKLGTRTEDVASKLKYDIY